MWRTSSSSSSSSRAGAGVKRAPRERVAARRVSASPRAEAPTNQDTPTSPPPSDASRPPRRRAPTARRAADPAPPAAAPEAPALEAPVALPESLARAVVVAPPSASAQALAALPLSALAWTWTADDPDGRTKARIDAALGSIAMLGVREVGHLATFSPDQVATRFGEAGRLLMARARATLTRPLTPFVPTPALVETLDLEGGVEALEPVLFALKRVFDRLEARLDARHVAATAIELGFTIERTRRPERMRLELSRPTRSSSTFHRLARERVGGALPGAVRRITAEVIAPVPGQGAQLDLFHTQLERLEAAELLVARLRAFLGDDAVVEAELRDTHRPEAAWTPRAVDLERVLESPTSMMTARPVAPAPIQLGAHAHVQAPLPDAASLTSVIGLDAPVPALRPRALEARPHEAAPSAEAPPLVGVQVVTTPTAATQRDPKLWPKPIERTREDEPLPPLPPRPPLLFAQPETARLTGRSLLWRGQRHTVAELQRRERFEAEWWRPEPLFREYMVLALADGVWLWAYVEPSDPEKNLWVHGLFD